MEIGIACFLVLACIVVGMSIPFSFLAGSVFYVYTTGISMGSVAPTAFFALEKVSLLAIPLFMIGGSLLEVSGIASKLINFAEALLKRVKGGMGATIPLTSMFFGALCGSGTATVAALSKIMMPRLEQLGWDRRYTAALIAASGPLGYMIPPNMNAIVFSLIVDVSVAALFLATVIPGIIWGLLYIVINRFVYHKWWRKPEDGCSASETAIPAPSQAMRPAGKSASYFGALTLSFREALPAFGMPVIILGGIYGGVFTPTEAGAVACVYAVFVGMLLYRSISLKGAFEAFEDTGKSIGSILMILPMVHVFTKLLILNQVPQKITAVMTGISDERIVILLVIDLILFIAGFFLDANVLILVVAPLLVPTAQAIGLDIVQLAVMLFVAVGVGTITPPMAISLFVVSKAGGVPVSDMVRPMMPFLLFGGIPVFLLVTFFPELSLWLPRVVMGTGG